MKIKYIYLISLLYGLYGCSNFGYSSGEFTTLRFIDSYIDKDGMEILLAEEHVSYRRPVIGHSAAKQTFKNAILYSSGFLTLDDIRNEKQKNIVFHKVGELVEDVSELRIDPIMKKAIIVDDVYIEDCDSYVGDCEIINSLTDSEIKSVKVESIQSEMKIFIYLNDEKMSKKIKIINDYDPYKLFICKQCK